MTDDTTLRDRVAALVDDFAQAQAREADGLRRQIDLLRARALVLDPETEDALIHYLRDVTSPVPYHNPVLERLRRLALRLRERKKRRDQEKEEAED